MRVVVDTNVLISALLKAHSGPARVVGLWRSGAIELIVSPEKEKVAILEQDPDDDKFLALALAGDATFIVSGDSHLLDLGTYQEITIMSPARFLDIIPLAKGGASETPVA